MLFVRYKCDCAVVDMTHSSNDDFIEWICVIKGCSLLNQISRRIDIEAGEVSGCKIIESDPIKCSP
jgi:hypothetical protein